MEYSIAIDGPIGRNPGELSARWFKQELARARGQSICVSINSEGGSCFEALSFYDCIKAYAGPKRCVVENAFSMGSILAMAFDKREITPNGYIMAHDPYMENESEPPILASLRKRLAEIYAEATRKPRAFIDRLMENETFMNSAESLRSGFVTAITAGSPVAVARFKDMVRRNILFREVVLARLRSQTTAKGQWSQAVVGAMAGGLGRTRAIVSVDKSHPGLRLKMIQEANER